MNKALISLAAGSLACLTQFSLAQHGQLKLDSTDVGHGGTNVYFAGSVLLSFKPDGGQSFDAPFDAYCTVLNVNAYIGSTWGATLSDTTQFVPSPNTGAIAPVSWQQAGSEIAWLANSYGITNVAERAAATQLAIWDIAEGGNGTSSDLFFNSSTGEIKSWSFNDNTISDAELFASSSISAYGAGTRAVDAWYQADTVQNPDGSISHVSQDFVAPAATPEPATIGLSLAGFVAALRRRSRARAEL